MLRFNELVNDREDKPKFHDHNGKKLVRDGHFGKIIFVKVNDVFITKNPIYTYGSLKVYLFFKIHMNKTTQFHD